MKASLVFQTKFTRALSSGTVLKIFMDLYLLPVRRGKTAHFPDDYRFSWIAFDSEAPEKRVLFDCHKDKGAHVHFDDKELERNITVTTPDEAEKLFYELIVERFGPLAPGAKK
jgi:hypothetical protein